MTRPLSLLAICVALALPAAADLRVEVDLSARALHVIEDDATIKTFEVAVGTRKNPTPTGTFSIRKIVWNPTWVPPDEPWARGKEPKGPGDPDNPMKRVKVFFQEPDYYIHGTDDIDSLGHAASHGCVRMDPEEVTELARLLMEHGGNPKPEPWYRRIFRRRSTHVEILTNQIAMRVKT
jgi:lipoprotein-anchoring transpeptidase ErfK/SrfK